MEVALKESLCGVRRIVLGIDGSEVPVRVAKPFKTGTEIVIAGHGMTRGRGGRGNLRVRFDVVYPEQLDDEVKEMIAALLPDIDR
jgi:DnaJ-class molecular chaperone